MKWYFVLLLASLAVVIVNAKKAHPYGRPINVIKFDENHNFIVDNSSITNLLAHPKVRDRKIVAVSIVGAFRKGKSFLMDYALRFMYANYKSVAFPGNPLSIKADWIGDPNEPLTGFSWRSGSDRDTSGVVFWSDVFLSDQRDEKTKQMVKIAIILIDTQGLFDASAAPADNARIFALGTLISSVQIFNLNDVIQEDQLEYLQMATDFARFTSKKSLQRNERPVSFKPFQNLVFLIRDWQNDDEYEYGQAGGAQYLANVLNIEPHQPQELQDVRKYIRNSFDQRLCFLLPHPGYTILQNKQYDGRFSELDENFQEHLKEFLSWILSIKNLKRKKILNEEVTGTQYLEYLKTYFQTFQSNEFPEIETLHDITVRQQYELVLAEALKVYAKNLTTVDLKSENQYKELNVIENELAEIHKNAQQKALKFFEGKNKLGSEADEVKFREKLLKNILDYFGKWKSNEIEFYSNMKSFEDEKKAELEGVKSKSQMKIENSRKNAKIALERLQDQHKNATEMLNRAISQSGENRTLEIEQAQKEIEKIKLEAEKHRQILQKETEEKKLEIRQKTEEMERRYKNELNKLQQEIKLREDEVQKEIERKQIEQLEIIRLEAEAKKLEFERNKLIAEKREKAMAEQKKYEEEMKAEEERIRKDTAERERLEKEKAEREKLEAQERFQQMVERIKQNGEEEERKIQEERNKQIEAYMLSTTPAPTMGEKVIKYAGKVADTVSNLFA